MSANLETEIHIGAPIDVVWATVSDLRRMPEWSPQCRKVLTRGPLRQGTFMLNLNSDGRLWWPTRTKVTDFSHLQRVAWRVLDNGTEWSFTLTPDGTGTRLTERRDVPSRGTSKISQFLVAKALGGEADFENELRAGMTTSLERIKAAAESHH